MKHLTSIASSLILVTLYSNPALAARPAYTITDLGTLGGSYSSATGLNAGGQVTGFSATGQNTEYAFIYDGTMHSLGSFGGSLSLGQGINASGHVTGYAATPNNAAQHAFFYDGMLHDLGTLGGPSSYGHSVNARGQVTGYSALLGGEYYEHRAFVWSQAAGMQNLGTLGGASSDGNAINDIGHVTGGSENADGEYHAFLYDGTMHDLGALDGTYSYGQSINAGGQITGVFRTPEGDLRAFLYDGTMHDLGTLGGPGSSGFSINASGHVVGFSQPAGQDTYHAFLYTAGQGMVDLNSLIDPLSGWELLSAVGINDSGQIAGSGKIDGRDRAFLLTPIQVPEPSSCLLVIAALTSVGLGLRSNHARFCSARCSG
jgi:probable HAF family extracellular repeat protein